MTSVPRPTQRIPILPQKPDRRPTPRRSHTLLFWTVLLLFVAGICGLAVLATRDSVHLMQSAEISPHPHAQIVVAICAIAAVAGATASRYHVR